MSFFEAEEILNIIANPPLDIYERSITEGYAKIKNGNSKYCHIHKFMRVKKK
jgi:hypothetical protein